MAGRLRFTRQEDKWFTCGSGGNIDYYITAILEYDFHPTRMRLLGDKWIVTAFEGRSKERGTRGCGLSGVAESSYAIRGRLAGAG